MRKPRTEARGQPQVIPCQRGPELTEFLKLCESCLGPRGSLKMVVSSAGSLMVTASSSRLWTFIQIEHPLVELIMTATRHLSDFRFFSTVLSTRLLHCSAAKTYFIDLENIRELVAESTVTIDLGRTEHLKCIAATILGSKPGTGLLGDQVDQLARLVVQAWLLSIRDDGNLGDVRVRVREGGGDEHHLMTGLLYKLTGNSEDHPWNPSQGPLKVVMYDVMLKGEQAGEEWEGLQLEFFRNNKKATAEEEDFVGMLRLAGVQLLCCRQVVGVSLRLKLMAERIGVLDRLGHEDFYRLRRMAGGQIQCSTKARLSADDLGMVEVVESVSIYGAEHIRLDSLGTGQVNLLLSSLGEEPAEELSILVKTAITALNSLVMQGGPQVLPGGGCLEARLALALAGTANAQQTGNGDNILVQTLLKTSLLCARLSMEEAMVDVECGHLWQHTDSKHCVCGLLEQPVKEQISILELYAGKPRTRASDLKKVTCRGSSIDGLLLDPLPLKRTALLSALETYQNLANIGAVLQC